MNRLMCAGLVAGAVTLSAAMANAQPAGQRTSQNMPDKTYQGCVAAGTTAGTFVLTHAETAEAAAKEMMAKEMMAKEMAAKKMTPEEMTKAKMAADMMAKEKMMALAKQMLTISNSAVTLTPHIGHKVSLTGQEGKDAKMGMMLSVKSLKMVAASCP